MSVPHLRCAFSLPDDPGVPMLKYSTPSPILKDYKVFQLGITKWMIFWYIPKKGGGSFLILFLQTFGVLNGPFDQMFGIFPIILDHEAVPYLQKLFLFLYLLCMSGGETGTILGLLTLISSWPQRQNGKETNLSCRKHSTEHSVLDALASQEQLSLKKILLGRLCLPKTLFFAVAANGL